MIDKVSKSLQSKDISTSTAAKMLVGLKVTIQSMRNAGIDEIYARATNNAQKMDIPDQFPETRKKRVKRLPYEQARDEAIYLTPQQKFDNEYLEVYDVIFGQIQWRN